MNDRNELITSVNGRLTSALWDVKAGIGYVAPFGHVAIFVGAGSLRIRKIDLHARPLLAPAAPAAINAGQPPATPGPVSTSSPSPATALSTAVTPQINHPSSEPAGLREALMSYTWFWVDTHVNLHRNVDFQNDGEFYVVRGKPSHWKLTGSQTMEVVLDNGYRTTLTFDPSFKSFTNSNQISGTRLERKFVPTGPLAASAPMLPAAVAPQPTAPLAPTLLAPVEGKNFRNIAGADLVWIRPGTFMMGSPEDEEGRDPNENLHPVTLTRGFWIGKTEVTQDLYQAVTGLSPSFHKDVGLEGPVEWVTWYDTHTFCRTLTSRERQAGRLPAGYSYGLPSEAQWEYACRAGTTGAVYNVDSRTPWKIVAERDSAILDPIAWYGHRGQHPVARKAPNAFGLYDTLGNAAEWCEDWFGDYPTGAVTDPTGPDTGTKRVVRGGAGVGLTRFCRAAYRGSMAPTSLHSVVGFRVALLSFAPPGGFPAETPAPRSASATPPAVVP